MADTFTAALKARKIEQGGYNNSYAARFNEDVVDIFDAAIAGTVEIDIGSSTTHTLEALQNGTLSDSHYSHLRFVGTPASAVTVTVPTSVTPSKEYRVENQTGQALTFKYAATSGVLVADGDTVPVRCDGTNVTEIIFGTLFKATSAEVAASVVPADESVPSHDKVGIVRSARHAMATGASAATNRQALVDSFAVLDGTLNGGIVGIGSGRYAISATVTFPQNSVIEGQGTSATQIQFDPASEDILFDVNVGSSTSVVRSGVRNLGFYSTNSVTKTAINVVDGRQCKIENVAINQGNWPGSGSIGIRAWGRDFYNIRDCDIECARPILISSNPNHATIDLDTSTMVSVQLYTPEATGANIEVESGVVISNWKLDTVNFAGGRYGFLREDTSSPIASYQLAFFNCRTEQGDVVDEGEFNTDGWSFRITSTAQRQQDLVWDSCHFDPYRNGIYLRNADKIVLRACTFVQEEGTALDITFDTQTVLILENTHIQAGVTVTLTNAVLVWAAPYNTSETAVPKYAIYRYNEGAVVSQKPALVYNNVKEWSWQGTLANGATLNTPVTVSNSTVCTIIVNAHCATGPISSRGSAGWTKGDGTTGSLTKLGGDANWVVAASGTELRVVDNGSGNLVISNALGQSATVAVKITAWV